MHLNKILEQIKRHQSPSEAIDKLSTALDWLRISLRIQRRWMLRLIKKGGNYVSFHV